MSQNTPYDPLNAPAPAPPVYKNVARCTVNRLCRAVEMYRDGLPERMNPDELVWDIQYHTLDAKFADGNPLTILSGTKLYDVHGKMLDNSQRPAMISRAFAAHGIRVFPGDPQYDEKQVVGNVFRLTTAEPPGGIGRPVQLPEDVLGPNYVYTGPVRIVTPKSERGGGQADAPARVFTPAPIATDLNTDEVSRQRLQKALDGVDMADEAAVAGAIRSVGLTNATVNGVGLIGHLVNETLVDALASIGVRNDG